MRGGKTRMERGELWAELCMLRKVTGRTCVHCEVRFNPVGANQKFCGPLCRDQAILPPEEVATGGLQGQLGPT